MASNYFPKTGDVIKRMTSASESGNIIELYRLDKEYAGVVVEEVRAVDFNVYSKNELDELLEARNEALSRHNKGLKEVLVDNVVRGGFNG